MTDDKQARGAVEKADDDHTQAPKNPPAGPHAKKELTDTSNTPGSCALPDNREESVEPGAG